MSAPGDDAGRPPNPVICYLCGKAVVNSDRSRDHVVPKQLIERPQPRMKGYDYAGMVVTHADCNNGFGPERYYQAALLILEVLGDETSYVAGTHPLDRNIPIMVIDASKFDTLDEGARRYFKLIDGRGGGSDKLPDPEFFADKHRTNPQRDAGYTAFSVLAKSAAALLITRYLNAIPGSWRILATAYWDEGKKFDLDGYAGETVPFDDSVKVWIKPANDTDWQVVYQAGSLVVMMVFLFSPNDPIPQMRAVFGEDVDIYEFRGTTLNELLSVGWKPV